MKDRKQQYARLLYHACVNHVCKTLYEKKDLNINDANASSQTIAQNGQTSVKKASDFEFGQIMIFQIVY